ncbi:MAG: nucleotide exchange factor GrpE [Tissierellaceae bacterium]
MKEENGLGKESEDLQEDISSDEGIQEEIVDSKDELIAELNNKLARLQADFVNYKKRMEKERESINYYATESFVSSLLPTIDNFERALESEDSKKNGFYEGIEMIYNQLIKTLKDNGVEEIDAIYQDFDPSFHHAVFMEESEEYESGKVLEVLQKGYFLKDKIIRPSMVKVSK